MDKTDVEISLGYAATYLNNIEGYFAMSVPGPTESVTDGRMDT